MEYIVGVDIGGTFTDCVAVDEDGRLCIGKALSTPMDFSIGVIDALRDTSTKLGWRSEDELIPRIKYFFHACTVGENILITRTGAKTGLITTRGFGDTILIMRSRVTEGLTEAEASHLSALTKPEPFVERPLIEEVSERTDYKGDILIRLDPKEAAQVIDRLVNKGVTSIAICLLWSISNDQHERVLADILKANHPAVHVSLSSEIAPLLGEYERTTTTVFNAYIAPEISTYLQNLHRVLKGKGLQGEPMVMQAYGGVLGMGATSKNAIGTIESGPAAGVLGSKFLGDLSGEANILATDMGGTTFKVGIIRDGIFEREYAPVTLRYNILSPKIWIESIGAGGGSIAWIDPETGLLKVGPQGAGARPGPACYGLGGAEPTVSDADLVLGYLNEEYFLGGRMKLDKKAALAAIGEKVARPLKMSETEAASGIFRIANSHMCDLVRRATVEKGNDPRNFALYAYGGAGPVHAAKFAAELGIKKVVVPNTASVQGAMGLISSDVVYQFGKSDRLIVPVDVGRVNTNFSSLCSRAFDALYATGFKKEEIKIIRSLDMRYRYQVHELNVPFPTGTSEITERDMELLYDGFDELYEKAYGQGSGFAEAGKELITFRVDAIGELRKPNIKRERLQKMRADEARKGNREVYFDEYRRFLPTDVYNFERMEPGIEIPGPAIIETPVTTIVVIPGSRATMDGFRNVTVLVES